MFLSTTQFNQNISAWNVSRVNNMSAMFRGATVFNNSDPSGSNITTLNNWYAPMCTTFASMFQSTSSFNQAIPILVDVSCNTLANMFQNASVFNQNISIWKTNNVTTLSTMFSGATMFNNGETGTRDLSGNPLIASYATTGSILTWTDASFLTSDLSINDVIIITTPTLVYSSDISNNITSNTSLVLRKNYGSNISIGTITSIKKQVAGTADLSWNTQNVTNIASTFQNATYFNQRLPWNTRKVGTVAGTVTTLFAGPSTSLINLFNNGQIITGTTQPLYTTPAANTWDFSGNANVTVRGAACHANCRLTAGNGITFNPAIY